MCDINVRMPSFTRETTINLPKPQNDCTTIVHLDNTDPSVTYRLYSAELLVNFKQLIKQKNEQDIYCICNTGYNERAMIECTSCENWFHLECIKMSRKEANCIETYNCNACKLLTVK